MKQPLLIQRCELGDGKLRYDYMGSLEFEVGDQSKSLKRIFAEGIKTGRTTVNLEAAQTSVSAGGGSTSVSTHRQYMDVPVYMVAGKDFVFADYRQHLQQLADNKLRLQEWINFDGAVKVQAGIESGRRSIIRTNVWFDIQNDLLWTLSEDNLKTLVSVLEGIKQTWSENK